jgi:ComF family protein
LIDGVFRTPRPNFGAGDVSLSDNASGRSLAGSILVIGAAARAIADGLLSIVLAPSCAGCRVPLEQPTASVVCDRCWNGIEPFSPPVCRVCCDPLLSWRTDDGRCPACRASATRIVRGAAIGAYDGILRSLLHALKYDGRRSVALPIAELMAVHGRDVLDGADCVVPVPLHWSRRWKRGFNQSAELARRLPVPMLQALKRRRMTRSQTALPASARRANVRTAFRVARTASIRDLCIVIVDDVSTTGATLDACAETLLRGGAREVRALTAARVVTRRPRRQR